MRGGFRNLMLQYQQHQSIQTHFHTPHCIKSCKKLHLHKLLYNFVEVREHKSLFSDKNIGLTTEILAL